MGFKVDDVFVDFFFRFGSGRRDAQAIGAAAKKMGRAAGTAADAQERLSRSTRRAGASARDARGQFIGMGAAAKGAKGQVAGLIKGFLGFEVARRLLTGVVRTFFDFRAEMNNVKAITGATGEEFQALTATAREMGRTTQFTATDAAGALKFLTRTGLSTNQAMAALPGTLNLAAASAVDLSTAADIATNVMKGMGLGVSELDRIVDVLAKTTTSSNVDIMELGESMKLVAPVANAAGQSIEEMAALMGVLGDAGIKGSLSGVALRRALINLTTGAGAAGRAIDRLGLQTRDAEGNFVGLANIFEQLEGKILGPSDLFELFGARALAAAQVLAAKGSEAINEFTESIDDSAGTAERMRKDQMEGLVGAGKRLKSAFEALAITFGSELEPSLVGMADAIRNFVIPIFNNMFRIIQLLGPAMFVLAESNIAAFNLIKDAAFKLGAVILETFGKTFRFVGELGERFLPESFLGDAAAGLAQFGFDAERMGNRFARAVDKDMDATIARFTESMGFAGESFSEILDGVQALGEDAFDTKGKVTELNKELEVMTANLTAAAGAFGLDLDVAPFQAQLVEARKAIREALDLGGEGAFTTAELVARERALLEIEEERADQIQAIIDAEKALADTLKEIARIQEDIVDNQEDMEATVELQGELNEKIGLLARQTRAADRAMDNLGKSGKKAVGGMLDETALVIRAVNRIADSFGLVNDNIRRAIDSVLDMIRALKEAKKSGEGISIAGAAGLAAGGIGIAASLLGGLFGESEAARRARETREANTEAIRKLTANIDSLRTALGAAPGEIFAGAGDLINELIRGEREITLKDLKTPVAEFTDEELRILQQAADALGITIEVVEDLGDSVLVNVHNLDQLKSALDAIDLSKLTQTFQGAVENMQRALDLLDIEGPLDELTNLRALFLSFTDLPDTMKQALRDADLTTAAGRKAFEDLLFQLFTDVSRGGIDLAQLGGLTLDQFLNALGEMEGLVDRIESTDAEAADDMAGATTDFVRSSRITEAQGSLLISILDSTRALERLQLTQLNRIADAVTGQPLTVPGPGALEGLAPGMGFGINIGDINVQISIAAGATGGDIADTIAEVTVETVDTALEAWRLDKERAQGL